MDLLSGPERDPPAALSQPADGRAAGRMEEEVVRGSTRGPQQACCSLGGRAWERQPPSRARAVSGGAGGEGVLKEDTTVPLTSPRYSTVPGLEVPTGPSFCQK